MFKLNDDLKANIVYLIYNSKTEEAIKVLSDYYRIEPPKIRIGVIQGMSKKSRAVYSVQRREIFVSDKSYLYDPFVILHEFYHHLRSQSGKHRGTERHANNFAIDFIRAFREKVKKFE